MPSELANMKYPYISKYTSYRGTSAIILNYVEYEQKVRLFLLIVHTFQLNQLGNSFLTNDKNNLKSDG